MTDPRPAFITATDLASTVIDGVRPNQRTNPTPCGDFDVAAMIEHLRNVMPRVAASVGWISTHGSPATSCSDWMFTKDELRNAGSFVQDRGEDIAFCELQHEVGPKNPGLQMPHLM